MTQGQGGVYLANGSGRDLYITRDPVVTPPSYSSTTLCLDVWGHSMLMEAPKLFQVFKGISEATPRVQTINPPGAVPRS